VNENLTHENFSRHLNTKFRVYYKPEEYLELELVEVTEVRERRRQESFALLFRGPLNIQLLQYLFRVEHDEMGEFELFLVPVARNEQGFEYEAVFNRLLEK
jgi:hypothetical protein